MELIPTGLSVQEKEKYTGGWCITAFETESGQKLQVSALHGKRRRS
jgi:hypothetical protein